MEVLPVGIQTIAKMKTVRQILGMYDTQSTCLDRMLHSTETTDGAIMLVTHVNSCRMCSLKIKEAGI